MKIMIELSVLAKILAYVAENKILMALEVESQQILDVEVIRSENSQENQFGSTSQTTTSESRRLGYIYDDEPLGVQERPNTIDQKNASIRSLGGYRPGRWDNEKANIH